MIVSFLRTFGTNTKRDNIGEGYTGYNSDTTGILFGEQFKKDDINLKVIQLEFQKLIQLTMIVMEMRNLFAMHASMFKQIDDEDCV